MTMKALITYAIAGSPPGDITTLNAIMDFYETWHALMDSQLEDLHLSRLDLEEQESDYLSIEGTKL